MTTILMQIVDVLNRRRCNEQFKQSIFSIAKRIAAAIIRVQCTLYDACHFQTAASVVHDHFDAPLSLTRS